MMLGAIDLMLFFFSYMYVFACFVKIDFILKGKESLFDLGEKKMVKTKLIFLIGLISIHFQIILSNHVIKF